MTYIYGLLLLAVVSIVIWVSLRVADEVEQGVPARYQRRVRTWLSAKARKVR